MRLCKNGKFEKYFYFIKQIENRNTLVKVWENAAFV
jgi:hypothetical protein